MLKKSPSILIPYLCLMISLSYKMLFSLVTKRSLRIALCSLRNYSSATQTNSGENKNASQQFKFTFDNPLLDESQRQFYEDNGFIVMKNFVDHGVLDKCRERFHEIIEGRGGSAKVKMRDVSLKDNRDIPLESQYYKIQDLNEDEVMGEFVFNKKILDYVQCFTGPNIMAIHSMLINKPPDIGTGSSRHPLHQDLYYFPFRPANTMVCVWTAMDTCNEANGCLFVVPGSHKKELQTHEQPQWEGGVQGLYYGLNNTEKESKKMLLMEKGDSILFHPLLYHGSGANQTNTCRKSISCHYASSDSNFIETKDTHLEKIENDLIDFYRRKKFPEITFIDYWKQKSACARGYEWK